MKITNAQFITSSPSYTQSPEVGMPTFAFVGRSNVGKSSLVNMLLNQRIAKTSSVPGKTQLINYFLVNKSWYLVDLPGYGWAKVSKVKKQQWTRMTQEYLLFSPTLTHIFLLIDARHTPQKNDLEFLLWLLANKVPCSIVFTKIDKINASVLASNTQAWKKLLQEHELLMPPFFLSSSTKKRGKEDLLRYIADFMV